MSKSNVICGAKNILAISMSLMLHNYFFITVKDQLSTVIKSLLQHGIRRGFVEKEKATQVYSVIKEFLSKKS